MIVGFDSDFSSKNSTEFNIDQFFIEITLSENIAKFSISNTDHSTEMISGSINLESDKDISIGFEYTPGQPYVFINFGEAFLQFKREEYGVVIDAFTSDGEVIEEYGYVLDEED